MSSDERAASFKRAINPAWLPAPKSTSRRLLDAEEAAEAGDVANIELGEQRYVELSEAEQFVSDLVGARLRQACIVLRIPDHRLRRQRYRRHGYLGKEGRLCSSSPPKIGRLVASFLIEEDDQVMLSPTPAS